MKKEYEAVLRKDNWYRVNVRYLFKGSLVRPGGWFGAYASCYGAVQKIRLSGNVPAGRKDLRACLRDRKPLFVQLADDGMQMGVQSYRVLEMLPAMDMGSFRRGMLAAGGIGPAAADKVMTAFDVFAELVVMRYPDLLKQARLSDKQQESLRNFFLDNSPEATLRRLLPKEILTDRMLEEYCDYCLQRGFDPSERIQSDPYRLLDDMESMSHLFPFRKVDQIALYLGKFKEGDPKRMSLCLNDCIEKYVGEQEDICVPLYAPSRMGYRSVQDDLLARYHAYFEDMVPSMFDLSKMIEDSSGCRIETVLGEDGMEEPYLYPERFYDAESKILQAVEEMAGSTEQPLSSSEIDHYISRFASRMQSSGGGELDDGQRRAIFRSLSDRLSIISGIPGAGKSTAVAGVAYVWQAVHGPLAKVYLLAPTGRAVKRMKDCVSEGYGISGYEANTVDHYIVHRHEFVVDARTLVVVDECSMLDLMKASFLFSACQNDGHMVLLGDTCQLPSIGAGSFLSDMIASGIVPVTGLSICHRTDAPGLAEASALIRSGVPMPLQLQGDPWERALCFPERSFEVVWTACPKDTADQIIRLYMDLVRRGVPLSEIAVVCPMKKAEHSDGMTALNLRLHDLVNPVRDIPPHKSFGQDVYDEIGQVLPSFWACEGKEAEIVGCVRQIFRIGDRILFTKNERRADVVNGDTGVIMKYAEDPGNGSEITIVLDGGGYRVIPCEWVASSISLAYAMTVHKAQGCEFRHVIFSAQQACGYMNDNGRFVSRNLLYTAVTRAKEKAYAIGSFRTVNQCILHPARIRTSTLVQRLQSCLLDGSVV